LGELLGMGKELKSRQCVYQDSYVQIDLWRHSASVADKEVHLTPIEWKLLTMFTRFPGVALSYEAIWVEVWAVEYPSLDLLKWHISLLRKHLNFVVEGPIVTVRGYGYRYDPHWRPE